jgi:RimJ/RimL family protein N-acetyltransferase
LSPLQQGDQAALVEHLADDGTRARLLELPSPYTKKDADDWVRRCVESAREPSVLTNLAFRREDGCLIGGIGLRPSPAAVHRADIGYWIAQPYRGKGLATAGVRALVAYGFSELGLKRIEATSFPDNIASHRVLEKAGLKREGLLVGYHLKNGSLIDACMFATVLAASTAAA